MAEDTSSHSSQHSGDLVHGLAAQPVSMRYLEAYGYIFQNPNWMMNILLGFVCTLIPIVGNIVLIGYQFEIVESLHRKPNRQYPDFDFNRFSDYLVRGVWPFLVNFVAQFVMQIVFIPLMYGGIILAAIVASSAGDEVGSILIVVVMVLALLFAIVIAMLAEAILVPMTIRAGLAQDFVSAFNFSWIWDFIKRVWFELILVILFMGVTGSIVITLGLLAFCLGMLPAMVIIFLAQAHLYSQLYRLYLARGGEPISLKQPTAQVVAG